MNAVSLHRILVDGTILSLMLGLLIVGSFLINVRIWLQDFPKAVQAVVPPLSPTEKRQRLILFFPLLAITIGVPLLSTLQLRAENGGALPFIAAYLNTYLVFGMFLLFDLFVIDYLMGTVLKLKFTVLPGSEGMEHLYQNFGYHLKDFWKAVVISAVAFLPIALVATL